MKVCSIIGERFRNGGSGDVCRMNGISSAGGWASSSMDFVGGDSWLEYASHGFVYLFADWKFITIFSTLFGA